MSVTHALWCDPLIRPSGTYTPVVKNHSASNLKCGDFVTAFAAGGAGERASKLCACDNALDVE